MNYIPNIKYKTQLCKNWLQNNHCVKNENCYFAHSKSELRTIEQNSQSIKVRNEYYKNYMNEYNYWVYPVGDKILMNYKTINCKYYEKGQCKLGQNCNFIHNQWQYRPKINNNQIMQYYYQYYNHAMVNLQTIQSTNTQVVQDLEKMNDQK